MPGYPAVAVQEVYEGKEVSTVGYILMLVLRMRRVWLVRHGLTIHTSWAKGTQSKCLNIHSTVTTRTDQISTSKHHPYK